MMMGLRPGTEEYLTCAITASPPLPPPSVGFLMEFYTEFYCHHNETQQPLDGSCANPNKSSAVISGKS